MAAASPLGSFSENATRLGMRIQETLTERITRDFGSSTTALFDTEDKTTDIRKRLDSTNDKEKIDALRRLIAMISKGRNVSEFFAQVVKNVASHNLEVRKLVYIYILRYAESEPDLALLSVNTFQRDLTDSNPLIRSMALRVLSGIRVAVIGSIVTLAIKKCSADVSPYVRKTAALAIPKCLSLDDGQRRELMTILVNFLNERSPLTIGTVLVAFNSVCPDRLDLLHPHYRRLCRLLPDADEWGQITIVNVLVRYARRMLPKPLVFQDHNGATVERIDSDLQLLFRSAESLFFSRNPAVVLAVSRALYYLGPPSDTPKIVPPLLKLLRTSTEIERVVVEELYIIARASPELLSSHYNRLFLRSSDLPSTKLAKLRILVKLMKSENASALLGEFTEYVHDRDDSVAAAAVDAIGTCARLLPEYTSRCIDILIRLMKDGIDAVGSSAVRVLKDLVQSNRRETIPAAVVAVEGIASVQTPAETVASLAHQFDDVRHPRAKACVLWLVGQYAAAATSTTATTATTATAKDGVQIQVVPGVENWAPDVLRRAVKSFAHDDKAVRLQTLTLTAKLLSLSPESEILGKLSIYCFSLARYDQSYDVRDRGRLLSTLLADICPKLKTVASSGSNNNQNQIQEQEREREWNEGTTDDDDGGGGLGRGMITLRKEQIQMILFQGKEPSEEEPDPVDPTMTLGSMALVTGKMMSEPWIVPDWEEKGTESSLRDSAEDRQVAPLAAYAVPTTKSIGAQGFGSGGGGGGRGGTPQNMSPMPQVTLVPSRTGTPSGSNWRDIDDFYADVDAKAASSSLSKQKEHESEEEESEEDDEDEEEEEDEGEGEAEEGEEVAEESEEEEEEDEEAEDEDEDDPKQPLNRGH